ncbi:hypothetical protein Baya_12965 [Bagarius yarrelli]|uniref:Uncharacterized protein n=1 Tax=Bagarius yarrelli TaxID=175774 RepID=A0A556V4Y0_BAGYA|nr:hypothetical protein Baya_12965 [Bagarius yarrelli]
MGHWNGNGAGHCGDTGNGTLESGHWKRDTGSGTLETGHWKREHWNGTWKRPLEREHWTLERDTGTGTGHWKRDTGNGTLDRDTGSGTLEMGHWEAGSGTLEAGHWNGTLQAGHPADPKYSIIHFQVSND